MTQNSCQTDILIAGGGIAGLTLAAILGRAGIDVSVIDNFPPEPLKDTKPSARTIALMQGSVNIIKAAGVWDQCKDFSAALKAMRITDHDIDIEFDAFEIGQEEFGFNVPNSILRATLYEQVQSLPSVTTYIPNALEDYKIEDNHVIAELKNGEIITARLLVGADGRNSSVRKISNIKCREIKYKQHAITCVINHSNSHDNISTEFHYPSGPLALVPLPGNQSSIVWVETPERAEELLALKESTFIETLQTQTNGLLGGIMLETKAQSWPLGSIRAKTLTAPRMALIAEAAHVMSPITAQGLNLSLRDVAALAEVIADCLRLGLDPGTKTILKNYESRRRIDITTRVFGVDGMNRIVSNDIPALQKLRQSGFKTLDRIPPLKKIAMQHGLAPQIDESRLAAGKPL
ncbi:MAG: 2-octaprenyl-6-methoxyphenyl hydroxylase [Micavibrio sp.]|nr:MAG: 2-octaprenyl-6-methoxyphenyl hydroxylase [Micavibrio sp.]